jgi:DNA anti-recombination protein RmuC
MRDETLDQTLFDLLALLHKVVPMLEHSKKVIDQLQTSNDHYRKLLGEMTEKHDALAKEYDALKDLMVGVGA